MCAVPVIASNVDEFFKYTYTGFTDESFIRSAQYVSPRSCRTTTFLSTVIVPWFGSLKEYYIVYTSGLILNELGSW